MVSYFFDLLCVCTLYIRDVKFDDSESLFRLLASDSYLCYCFDFDYVKSFRNLLLFLPCQLTNS